MSEATPRIMYVCSVCADAFPEACGYYDLTKLRVMPDGRWLCQDCYNDAPSPSDRPPFQSLPLPPEYRAQTSAQDTKA